MYSAKKVGGQTAYKAARKGKEIALQPVDVTVQGFKICGWNSPQMEFDIRCSKGTYIRALARDMGEKTSVGAYLSALRRTASGDFPLSDCLSIDAFTERLQTLPAPIPKAN